MQPIETIRCTLFLGVVVFVYVAAVGVFIRLVRQRLGRKTLSQGRPQVWYRVLVLGLAAFGTLCIAYGFLNSPDGLPVFKDCLTKIARIAPTFAVRGNWDAWYWHQLDVFGGTGAHELRSETVKLDVRGTTLRIAGVPVGHEIRIDSVLDAIPPGDFSVFLYHYPDEIMDVARRKADLFCAGHIHGGQIALPFYGALVTLSRLGKRFEAGLYRVDATWLYVSRGIGMEGGLMPRVRFCARPEVTVIEVHPSPAR